MFRPKEKPFKRKRHESSRRGEFFIIFVLGCALLIAIALIIGLAATWLAELFGASPSHSQTIGYLCAGGYLLAAYMKVTLAVRSN